jgi:hypothetical protein
MGQDRYGVGFGSLIGIVTLELPEIREKENDLVRWVLDVQCFHETFLSGVYLNVLGFSSRNERGS